MAHLRFGAEFSDEDLVALFDCIEIADFGSGHDAPDDLTRELISVMQKRSIGDSEELARPAVLPDHWADAVLDGAAESFMPPRILGLNATEQDWFDQLAEVRAELESTPVTEWPA